MKRATVFVCLVLLMAAPIFASGEAEGEGEAETVTMTLGTSQPSEGGFLGQMPAKFRQYLEEESDGRIDLRIHYSGALSSNERELAEMTQSGATDFAIGATTYVLGWMPSAKVFDLPYLFNDVDHFRDVVNGEVGEILRDEISDDGVELLSFILPGFRSIFTADEPIESLEDLEGLKIRSMESPVYLEMFEALGMLPTPMPSSELYSALQTGVVDAGENDPASVVSWGWIDVIEYYLMDRHTLSTNVLIMNKDRYDSLPADLQDAVRTAALKAQDYQLNYIQGAWDDAMEQIKEKGITVTELSDAELQKFQDAVSHIVDEYEEELGKGLVDSVRAAAE